ncbi:Cof-type HAD-IIB family hydrolase [Agrococcus sp. ARC_14]|uniref:Cof-type HAD-IIB family hydrolase n=1 Tax=Agrococcus sp. ARC_14 TaxID=2919927 RepID=UPI001F068BE8|nr:Cof-type HAD-IIB family hydrolase [Agrococcus sp. ARC_14]MCH1882006.1 Cof-type HAD-IIB family hydrolase [Agrococcus sp. ARC_14]
MSAARSLIALDVDGTLIDAAHRIADRTQRAIAGALDAGVFVVIASARGPAQLHPIFEQVPRLADGHAVMFQGALVARPDGSAAVTDAPIDAMTAEAVASRCRLAGATLNWFAGEHWHAERRDALVRAEEQIVESTSTVGVPSGLSPHKLLAMIAPARTAALVAVQQQLPVDVHAMRSHPHYLEITKAGVEKGTAVRQLASLLAVPPERTASVGDGENDISMFAATAHSYAMGNAAASVRAAASQVVPSNEQDGCAVAIESFIAELHRS